MTDTLNTGRSSCFDNYQSDFETNSDTINDFSQYSDNENKKPRYVENLNVTPTPTIQTNVPITVDHIAPKITNGIHLSDDSSVDLDTDDEDNSMFEITKKTTIRKIITRTTSINGVEKENEVKEFLIKDSQSNDNLLDSKKREDGTGFISSRRGSHASVRRKSLVDRGTRGRNEKSRRGSEAYECFKSDLEKIKDEFEEKEALKHSNQGLNWILPENVRDNDVDDKCEFKFRLGENSIHRLQKTQLDEEPQADIEALCDFKTCQGESSILGLQRTNPDTEKSSEIIKKDDSGSCRIKINFDDKREVPSSTLPQSCHRLTTTSSDESNQNCFDINEKIGFKIDYGDETPIFRGLSSSISNNSEHILVNELSNEVHCKDTDADKNCGAKTVHRDTEESLSQPSYGGDGHNNGFNKSRSKDSRVCQPTEGRMTIATKHIYPSTEMKWVDPMKSYHLKYDGNDNNISRRQSTYEIRSSSANVKIGSKNQSIPQLAKFTVSKKVGADNRSKSPTIYDIREYIVRGNIKEDLFQARRPFSEQLKSPANARPFPNRVDYKLSKPYHVNQSEQIKPQFSCSASNLNYEKKMASFTGTESFKSPRRSSRRQRFDSVSGVDFSRKTSLPESDNVRYHVSKILHKVDDLEKHINESSQSVPHICPGDVHHFCCHAHSCCGNVCMDRMVRLNSSARRHLAATVERANTVSVHRSGDRSNNIVNSNEPLTTPYESKLKSVLDKRVLNLERRLQVLQSDMKEYKTSNDIFAMEPETNVTSQCRNIERQLQLLYESIHQIRGVS